MTSFGCPTESYVCSVVHPFPFEGMDSATRRELRVLETVAGVEVIVAEDGFFRGGMSGGDAEYLNCNGGGM